MNKKYSQDVCIDRLMERVKCNSSWARIAGSEDELASFGYIKEEMEKQGFETKLHLHDAYISVPESASLAVAGQVFPCQTHSVGISTPIEGVEGVLVYGETKDKLTRELCQDKIVILEGRAVREPIIRAHELGARGVICISGEYIYESCLSPVWGSPSYKNEHLLPTIPVVSVTVQTGEQLKALAKEENQMANLQTKVDSGWRKIPLLEATLRADVKTDKFIMFSGHVDSWYYGAMDNGTSNATMMEVGAIAATHKADLRYNLRLVFFSGHSQGRYAGSSWYADTFWEDIHLNCLGSINIDSVGAKGAMDLTRSTVMPEMKPLAKKIIKEETRIDFEGRRYSRFADQSFWGTGVSCAFASFSKQLLGDKAPKADGMAIPIGGSLDLGWWWHTPADTFDKIEPANLERDAKVFTSFVMTFLTAPVLPLDFRESSADIVAILKMWQEKAAGRFSLETAMERGANVDALLQEVYAVVNKGVSTAKQESFNQLLWDIGRILVPLNYTQGYNFQNDPAVAQPPMPSLMGIDELIKVNPGEDFAILVELKRRRNYVEYMLLQAIDKITNWLEKNR